MSFSQAVVGSVGWLTMDRPAAMNSLNRELATGLIAQLNAWRNDDAVRVVVVTGNGRAFCAGADLIEAAEAYQPGKREFLELIVEFFDTLRAFPKPVIAAVNGLALAGGLEVVLACDVVLAAESARLGDAHSNFGVFPRCGRRGNPAAQGACERGALPAVHGRFDERRRTQGLWPHQRGAC